MSETKGESQPELPESKSKPEGEIKTESKVEEIARKYDFQLLRDEMSYSDEKFVEYNKLFLAMLDSIVGKTDILLPEEEVTVLDIGSGVFMPYEDALLNFCMRYNKDPNQTRKVNLILWEGAEDSRSKFVRQEFEDTCYVVMQGGFIEDSSDVGRVLENITKESKKDFKSLDIVTMFDLGPSPDFFVVGGDYLSIPLEGVEPFIKNGGIIILTTSVGGQDKEKAIKTFEKNGFEILVNEKNNYGNMFKAYSNRYKNVIIARKKKK